ncbi:MAG: hypothetical protein JSS64_03520 [Bacteroidetes bacterium]|nr:hypothetical protein [Bacteroidota bacterium]
MSRYIYLGKHRTVAADKLLFNGAEYDLPDNDPHVKALAAKGLLKLIAKNDLPKKEKQ